MARVPEPRCPIRDNQPCGLCLDGVTGPADCGLVWLVMNDPELREGLRTVTAHRLSTSGVAAGAGTR